MKSPTLKFSKLQSPGRAVACYIRIREEGRQLDSGEASSHQWGQSTHLSLEMCHKEVCIFKDRTAGDLGSLVMTLVMV